MKYVYRLIVLLCTFIVVACDTAGNNNATLVVTSATDVNLGMYGDNITITYKISGDSEAIAKVDISASWLSIVEHNSSDNLFLLKKHLLNNYCLVHHQKYHQNQDLNLHSLFLYLLLLQLFPFAEMTVRYLTAPLSVPKSRAEGISPS